MWTSRLQNRVGVLGNLPSLIIQHQKMSQWVLTSDVMMVNTGLMLAGLLGADILNNVPLLTPRLF